MGLKNMFSGIKTNGFCDFKKHNFATNQSQILCQTWLQVAFRKHFAETK